MKENVTLNNAAFMYIKGEENSEKIRSIYDEKITEPIMKIWWLSHHYYSLIHGVLSPSMHEPNKHILSTADYLSLLTPKQPERLLTEADLVPPNRFECIENWYYMNTSVEYFTKGLIYPCNLKGYLDDNNGRKTSLKEYALNRHFKLISPLAQQNFYCKEWNNVGYVCEEQCNACRKTNDLSAPQEELSQQAQEEGTLKNLIQGVEEKTGEKIVSVTGHKHESLSDVKPKLIKKYLHDWHSPMNASIEHYAKSGKVSGSLYIEIGKMMDEYANQQNASLQQEEVKEESKAETFLKKGLTNTHWNYIEHVMNSGRCYNDILNAMEQYATQKTSLLQQEVDKMRELLKESKRFCGGSLQARIDNLLN